MLIKNGDYPIDEDKSIVRYISFTKFVDLILSEKLYFTSAKILTDQYEFQITKDHKKEILTTYSEIYDPKKATEVANMFERTALQHKYSYYINSWSEEVQESYAMWKIYLNNQDGVSIKTDFHRLKKALANSSTQIEIGKVIYDDKLGKSSNQPKLLFRKQKFYKYEQEVRLCYFSPKFDFRVIGDQLLEHRPMSEEEYDQLNFSGFKEPIDISTLITEIRISPFSSISFERLVNDFLLRTKPELVKRIVKSDIRDK